MFETVYRPDIDGLRAFAVTAVVLFHLDLSIARGGFIGVDVFFVISGYLITGMLQFEIGSGKFSIPQFYERRIKRIFPALFATLVASSTGAFFLFFPPEILDFAKSAIAATLFSSNVYFMATTDYFNSGAETNPLLHTWSLAVEEQFYIVFPVLMYSLRSLRSRDLRLVMVALTIISFALSVELVGTNQVAAFYSAPSRAWELLVGALLALKCVPKISGTFTRELLATFGAALLIAGCLRFYANMPFPGVRALVPCIGAALLIHTGSSGRTLLGSFLCCKPIVFVGLISYSLYLCHWPIIVFFQLWWSKPLGAVAKVGLVLTSCAIATLSWRFIESPFRRKSFALSRPALWRATAGSMAGACAIGLGVVASGGLAFAYPKEVVRIASYLQYDERAANRLGTCFIDAHSSQLSAFPTTPCLARSLTKPNLLVVGDSHAAHLWKGLATALPSIQILQATATGCKPVFGTHGHPTCIALINRALGEETATGRIDAILLSARWEHSDIAPLVATVDRLAARGLRVYVSGPIVEYHQNLPRLLARSIIDRDSTSLITTRLDIQRQVDQQFADALEGHNAVYLSAYKALCPQPSEACTVTKDGVPVQWDYGHLTAEGSEYVARAWMASGRFDFVRSR